MCVNLYVETLTKGEQAVARVTAKTGLGEPVVRARRMLIPYRCVSTSASRVSLLKGLRKY